MICNNIPEQKQEFEAFRKLLKSDKFKRKDHICITAKELIKINEDFSLFEKVKIKQVYLFIDYPTEIDYNTFKNLCNRFGVYAVVVKGLTRETYVDPATYEKNLLINSNIWMKYLKKLKFFTKDINKMVPKTDTDNSDIIKFCILCNRIAQNVVYDLNGQKWFMDYITAFYTEENTSYVYRYLRNSPFCFE